MPLAVRRSLGLARALARCFSPTPHCVSRPAVLEQVTSRGFAAAAPRFLYHAAVYLMLERGNELLMARRRRTAHNMLAHAL